jgi:L-iditol 2-dehydrogenase
MMSSMATGQTTAGVARLHATDAVRVADEVVPVPRAGESLVRVEAVGLCGSDLNWYEEGGIGDAVLARPLVVGHEFSGVVEGGPLDGAAGALLEPLGVALHAFDLGHVHLTEDVAVIGCGPIGLLLIQVLRAAGARVVLAVDPRAHRRAAAERAGARLALAPEELRPAGTAAVAFEVAGTDATVETAIGVARPGARAVLAGIPADDRTTFPASVARRKGLTLVMVRRMNDVYARAIRLVEDGLVELDRLVTDRYPLAQVADAFAVAAARTGLKVLVEPQGTVARG